MVFVRVFSDAVPLTETCMVHCFCSIYLCK